jgi:hypothetical protein
VNYKSPLDPSMSDRLRMRSGSLVGAVIVLVWALMLVTSVEAFGVPQSVDRYVGAGIGSTGGSFSTPRDVAVNETGAGAADPGDVYVVEFGSNRVSVLAADGTFKRTFGGDVIAPEAPGGAGTGFEICVVAADCRSGSSGTGAGQFNSPQAVAVDQDTGNVYVADRSNRRIQMFDASGAFLRLWGWNVVASGPGNDVAAPVDEFEICVPANNDVCQTGVTGSGAGQIGNQINSPSLGLAITPGDGNPATGQVFLADSTNRRINVYGLDGTSPSSFGSATQFPQANQPRLVAVDSRGIVYASDSANSGEIDRYDTAGVHGAPGFLTPIAASVANLNGAGTTLGLEVDPDSDGGGADEDVLYVLRDPSSGNSVVRQFGPTNDPGALAAPTTSDETHMANEFGTLVPNGLGIDTVRGNLLVASSVGTACGGTCHGIFVLDEDGTGSSISASAVAGSGATPTTIDVVGTVDPDDGLVRYRFEYSATGSEPYSVTPYSVLSGTGPVSVSVELTGLNPNSLYRVRLRVEKILGPTSGVIDTSTEAITSTAGASPTAETLGTDQRTATSATLRGLIDPRGTATTYYFEYGPAGGSFDNRVPVPDASAGSGNGESLVLQPIAGLLPNTSYQYRLVAGNSIGGGIGATLTFTTEVQPDDPEPLPDRVYELVSPAYKIGGIGLGTWGPTAASTAEMGLSARDGERFAAHGTGGSMLLNGAQAYANDWAFADRIDDQQGWVSHSPFTHGATSGQLAKFLYIQAASDDMSRLSWVTNNATIGIFPETLGFPESANPSFFSSWDGRWEIFGPTESDPVAAGQFPASFPTGVNRICDMAFASGGSRAVCTTKLHDGIALMRGVGGATDPSSTGYTDLVGGRMVYFADSSGDLANNFQDTGVRMPLNVCSTGTQIPSAAPNGKMQLQGCVHHATRLTLVSPLGASVFDIDTSSDNGIRGPPENVVSEDGSRAFFMAPDPLATGVPDGASGPCTGTDAATVCPPQLFVRQDNGDGTFTTRLISKAEDGLFGSQDIALTGTVRFERATPDGDKVFFRTNSPLTADDRNGTGVAPVTTGSSSIQSWDLYRYDFPDDPNADPADGELTRISAGPTGAGDCNVQPGGASPSEMSAVLASRYASSNGDRVMFTCAAPLPAVTPPGNGTVAEPGGDVSTTTDTNLYLYDAGEPQPQRYKFVARVPRSSSPGVANCAGAGVGPLSPLRGDVFHASSNCVRGTSDGSFITFWTAGRLIGDDPNATTADIYGYDVEADELSRITAPQGGVGGTYPCGTSIAQQCYGDGGYDHMGDTHRAPTPALGVATDPLVPGDRLAFFQSMSRLVAEDVDDLMDVYQWRNGDLSLVSSGDNETSGAYYRGNDRTGRNVYFVTQDSHSWQDFDSVFDAYTARAGGGIVEPSGEICTVLAGECRDESGTVLPPAAGPMPATGGNAIKGVRPRLTVASPSARSRRRAARTGTLSLRVRSNVPGVLSIVGRAKAGGETRIIAKATTTTPGTGIRTVRLRLSAIARRHLGAGRRLRVALTVSMNDARSAHRTIVLKGARR